jgi:DNA-binding IclR family transcriptional regulator
MSESGTHQNARRIAAALSELARHPVEGARLTDISLATSLGKGTVHRLLAGLVETGLADQDPASGRFFLGMQLVAWATDGRRRFAIAERLRTVIDGLCRDTEDTVYLAIRDGDGALYIDRREGTHPLKALPVEIGARRPLGVGAAPLAMLAFGEHTEVERIVTEYREARLRHGIDDARLRELIARSRALGYALHDGEILPGFVAIGMPVLNRRGIPVAAISIAAVRTRFDADRQRQVAALMRDRLDKAGTVVDL